MLGKSAGIALGVTFPSNAQKYKGTELVQSQISWFIFQYVISRLIIIHTGKKHHALPVTSKTISNIEIEWFIEPDVCSWLMNIVVFDRLYISKEVWCGSWP